MLDKNDSGYSTNTSLQLKESRARGLQLSPFQGYTCMFLVASLFWRNCHTIENIMKSVYLPRSVTGEASFQGLVILPV